MRQIEGNLKNLLFQSPQVLAVDRDEDNLVLVYQALEMFGYTSVVTQDRQMAFTLAKMYQPNLILLAISATHDEDIKLLRSFKDNPQTAKLPIIALTTLTRVEECDRLRSLGCDNYLCKPYLIEELGTIVAHYIPSHSTHSSWISAFGNFSEGIA
ncbi:MAG: response regulator [Geitlerinemataceae cyanobacterium]